MYTRSYDENLGILIPESYSGTALREDQRSDEDTEPKNERQAEETFRYDTEPGGDGLHRQKNGEGEAKETFFSKLTSKGFLGNIFNNDKFGLQKIGSEEILIIAAAAFLMFSKNGDKECAIMLLLLLFLY